MDKIVLADKLYIPTEYVSPKKVQKRYVKSYFSDYGCRGCEHKPNRPTNSCVGCDNYGGTFDFTKKRIVGNVEYIGLPLGDRTNMQEYFNIDFSEFKVEDRRCKNKFDYKIKIDLGEDRDWFDYQDKTVEAMKKAKHGIFVLPPRSGKSLTMLRILIELGYKAIIIADQFDFLDQFIGDIEESTNLPALQEKTGKKLYGFIDKISDLKHIQIGISTWQSFISEKGKKLFKEVNRTFGAVGIDEVQASSSPVYNDVINRFRSFIRIGCTGTEFKKNCFASGTQVAMADGTYKNIEDIKTGDLVLSFDHASGRLRHNPVTETHTQISQTVKIIHDRGVIECTPDHKFWVESEGRYVMAKDLTGLELSSRYFEDAE